MYKIIKKTSTQIDIDYIDPFISLLAHKINNERKYELNLFSKQEKQYRNYMQTIVKPEVNKLLKRNGLENLT